MNKKEFLAGLYPLLSDLPRRERRERLAFYSEMIDDRMEEGISEEEAVLAIGPVRDVAREILSEQSVKLKSGNGRKIWLTVLLITASPIWVSLLISALAVLLSLVAALWSLIVSAFAMLASFVAAGLGCLVLGGVYTALGKLLEALGAVGVGIFLLGLSILTFFLCLYFVKAGIYLTRLSWRGAAALFGKGR